MTLIHLSVKHATLKLKIAKYVNKSELNINNIN